MSNCVPCGQEAASIVKPATQSVNTTTVKQTYTNQTSKIANSFVDVGGTENKDAYNRIKNAIQEYSGLSSYMCGSRISGGYTKDTPYGIGKTVEIINWLNATKIGEKVFLDEIKKRTGLNVIFCGLSEKIHTIA